MGLAGALRQASTASCRTLQFVDIGAGRRRVVPRRRHGAKITGSEKAAHRSCEPMFSSRESTLAGR